jgi:hypothetical protein
VYLKKYLEEYKIFRHNTKKPTSVLLEPSDSFQYHKVNTVIYFHGKAQFNCLINMLIWWAYIYWAGLYYCWHVKKCKDVPLRHVGAKGERLYSSYSFFTSALDGASGQSHAPAALYLWERTPPPSQCALDWRLCGPQSCWVGVRPCLSESYPRTDTVSIPQIHEWIWSRCGNILTAWNRRTRRKCPGDHHKPHIYCSAHEPWPSRWDAGD